MGPFRDEGTREGVPVQGFVTTLDTDSQRFYLGNRRNVQVKKWKVRVP